MIRISSDISIDEKEIKWNFIRASGPGGQNINKVASAVQLRFNVYGSHELPDGVRQRLIRQSKNSVNEEGILVIEAKRYRSQHRNRTEAMERLVALIQKAAIPPKKRIKTRPSAASKIRMRERKRHHSIQKHLRSSIRNTREE